MSVGTGRQPAVDAGHAQRFAAVGCAQRQLEAGDFAREVVVRCGCGRLHAVCARSQVWSDGGSREAQEAKSGIVFMAQAKFLPGLQASYSQAARDARAFFAAHDAR